MEIPLIRIAHKMGLGVGDPWEIELVGYDISAEDRGFVQEDTFASRDQKVIHHSPLKPNEDPGHSVGPGGGGGGAGRPPGLAAPRPPRMSLQPGPVP